MSARTPIQQQAKRVYDALCEAQDHANSLAPLDDAERHFTHRLQVDIERLLQYVPHLMHEDDCE